MYSADCEISEAGSVVERRRILHLSGLNVAARLLRKCHYATPSGFA